MTKSRLDAGIAALSKRYTVEVSAHALDRSGYLAGDDGVRAAEINRFLRDPDVRAVILSRGGYGLMRILDQLDADALRRDPKIIVGYSDATALLAWAMTAAAVRGIHGPMAAHFGELGKVDRRWLINLMESPEPAGIVPDRGAAIGSPSGGGPVSGRLVGGNLCLLSSLCGTPYQVDAAGGVLVIEDVGERPYKIDRYMTHLALAGCLDGAIACVAGEFVRCEETVYEDAPTAEQVIDERLRAHGIVGIGPLPIGHGDRNLAFPYGGLCEVDPAAGRLRYLEAAVS